jgi:hypothetical protein
MINRTCAHCGNGFTVASIYSNRKYCGADCRFKAILPGEFTDECANWPKSVNKVTGYGQFNLADEPPKKTISAHRMAYTVFVGPLADGEQVLHRCDNRACVNPRHLFNGSQAENMADMWSKGRQQDYSNQPCGDANPSRKHPERLARGARQGSAKLDDAKALEILQSTESHAALARRFGVTASAVMCVRKRKTWRHVTSQAV